MGRSLRDLYTGFALGLPLVGARICVSDQREPRPEGDISHEVTAPRAVGPAGRPSSFLPQIADLNLSIQPKDLFPEDLVTAERDTLTDEV